MIKLPLNTKFVKDYSINSNYSWVSLKQVLKENLQRQREREKSLRKKRIFSGKTSLLKNSLSLRKFSFHFLSTFIAFSTSSNSSKSSKTSNASIFTFIHYSPGKIKEKSMKENFLWEKRIFSKEIFSRENSLFSEIFLYLSVSLQILFQNVFNEAQLLSNFLSSALR